MSLLQNALKNSRPRHKPLEVSREHTEVFVALVKGEVTTNGVKAALDLNSTTVYTHAVLTLQHAYKKGWLKISLV